MCVAHWLCPSHANKIQVLIGGCRCIEIDVHNGEPSTTTLETKSSDTSSASTSPKPHSPKPEHRRHLSGSTLAEAFEKVEATYHSTKKKVIEKTGLGVNLLPIDERSKSNDNLSIGKSIERPPSQRSLRTGEPLVLHGWTLTAPVGFRAVCKTIRETAFLTSNFPIIVSLEVHADLEQQEVMVNIMKEEWAGLLIEEAHEACNPDERLPRLDEMLNKILIKVKKVDQTKLDQVSTHSTLAPAPTRQDGDSGASSDDERSTKKKVKKGICKNLSDLGIYTHSEHFQSFEAASASKPSHIFSIEERTIMELHEKKKSDMFTHNRNFFMRAYPAGFRIDSSNLDPSVFWRKGIQMVALNWQNLDAGVMLNEGMFAGEHGWVLKPPGYRSDPTEPIQYKTLDLKITVFAGQHIPLPPGQTDEGFHPYIRCELHVEKQEERTGEPIEGGGRAKDGEHKRKTPWSKGDHPDFGREGSLMNFSGIRKVVEELSFVRLVRFPLLLLTQFVFVQRATLNGHFLISTNVRAVKVSRRSRGPASTPP
jgi:phosphatidylinositol phospholipase C delta